MPSVRKRPHSPDLRRRLRPRHNLPYVSASRLRAYLLRDPVLDWFELHAPPAMKQTGDSFTTYVMSKGVEFEARLVGLLKTKFGSDFVDLGGTRDRAQDPEMVEQTRQAMSDGHPFLYQATLLNSINNTGGLPDLLVRSDHLSRLVEDLQLPSNYDPTETSTLGDYHYLVVDIKYTTLRLRADGIHLLNSGCVPAYKGQVYVYNQALAQIQGYEPPVAFLLGRRWTYISKDQEFRGHSCFERLGAVNFRTVDADLGLKVAKALEWRREVITHGAEWDPFSPHRIEMYPNLANNHDYPWTRIKKEIASKLDDITMLWMCGAKQRNFAHESGITRWTDARCIPSALGIHGEYTSTMLEAILQAQTSDRVIHPPYLELPAGPTKLWIDFETSNDAFDDLSELPRVTSTGNLIFMIGIGYDDPLATDGFVYRDFTVNAFTQAEECRICLQAIDYLRTFEGRISLRHWSHHESTCWNTAMSRHEEVYEAWLTIDARWDDLLKCLRSQQLAIKGALGYGLKEVTGALHRAGLIKTSYQGSAVADGADAMVQAYRASEESRRTGTSVRDTEVMKRIVDYNRLDCRVLMELERAIERHNQEMEE